MALLIAFLLAIQPSPYKGESLLNVVVVGKDYRLNEIKEIESFTALYVDGVDPLIHFLLTVDGNTRFADDTSGLLPTLILHKAGEELAAVHLRVGRLEKENRQLIEWKVAPSIAEDSYCIIQMTNQNREAMVTLKLPLSTAKVTVSNKQRERREMTLSQLNEELTAKSIATKTTEPATKNTNSTIRPANSTNPNDGK